jgi:LmbE family N-acetylglucosaminyl deacetylase
MRTAMVISPHADDAAIFCGGAMARFAAEGWRVILVRVTDDRYDSVGLDVDQTVQRNALELQKSATVLGVAEVVELGFETDRLADTPETVIRERIVYLFRKFQPHTVFSFDPTDIREDNQDHVRVAQAVAEAFWVSCFDKHCPQHLAEGLEPFAPAERWFYSRNAPGADYVLDITGIVRQKVAAVLCHETMMRNVLNQYRLQLRTAGRRMAMIDAGVAGGDLRPLVEMFVCGTAQAVAQAAGFPEGHFAEAYRRERFGDLDELFAAASEAIPEGE